MECQLFKENSSEPSFIQQPICGNKIFNANGEQEFVPLIPSFLIHRNLWSLKMKRGWNAG